MRPNPRLLVAGADDAAETGAAIDGSYSHAVLPRTAEGCAVAGGHFGVAALLATRLWSRLQLLAFVGCMHARLGRGAAAAHLSPDEVWIGS